MEAVSCTLFLLVVFLLADYVYRRRFSRYPPGPYPLPMIGNVLNLLPDPREALKSMHRKYGDILALDFGYFRTVIIKNPAWVREIFNMEACNGASLLLPTIMDYSKDGEPVGVASLGGVHHNEIMRLLRKQVKDVTSNTSVLDFILLESADEFLRPFQDAAKSGRAVSTGHLFNMANINVLWRWITGERADFGEPEFSQTVSAVLEYSELVGPGNPSFFFPLISKLAPRLSGWNKIESGLNLVSNNVQNVMNSHTKTLHLQEERGENLMDAFVKHAMNIKDLKSAFHGQFGIDNIRGTVVGLLFGGIETTAVTISWALLYLLKTPGVQERLHAEIDAVIGRDKKASVLDSERMPYLNSFLLEVFRFVTIAPLGVPHKLIEDISFHGHEIPKDTLIFANIDGIHHDEVIWGPDVNEFSPWRFVDAKSKVQNLYTFSVGKRSCPGEPLARRKMFLFFTSMLQMFEFRAENSAALSTQADCTKMVLKPHPFEFKVKIRT